MTPVDWAKRPLQKYADFSGRASRPEYWWFVLAQIVVLLVAMLLDSMLGTDFGDSGYGFIYMIAALALLLPAIAVGVRRLHDTDRSGWWLLIALVPLIGAIVLIVFFASEGTSGDNQFGAPPATA
ncbi:MAG: DUF805 domain-containing protein [Sphingomicrobium sp.]